MDRAQERVGGLAQHGAGRGTQRAARERSRASAACRHLFARSRGRWSRPSAAGRARRPPSLPPGLSSSNRRSRCRGRSAARRRRHRLQPSGHVASGRSARVRALSSRAMAAPKERRRGCARDSRLRSAARGHGGSSTVIHRWRRPAPARTRAPLTWRYSRIIARRLAGMISTRLLRTSIEQHLLFKPLGSPAA